MTAALTAFAGLASGMAWSRNAHAQAGMSRMTAYAFSFAGLAGGGGSETFAVGEGLSPGFETRMTEFAGPVLVVTGELDVLFCPGGAGTCRATRFSRTISSCCPG